MPVHHARCSTAVEGYPAPVMPASAPPAELRLIGEAVCIHGPGEVLALEHKDALMLAYLAIEGPTPRRALAALLWPDVDAERSQANLRQRLFRLRRSLGFDLLQGAALAGLPAHVTVDLHSNRAGAGELLSAVTDGDAGGLAAWLLAQRLHRRNARIEALEGDAARCETAGQLREALAAARQVLACDATSEQAHRQVMRLNYLRGDRSAALLAFDHCEQVLKDDVGTRPSAETLALLQTIESAGTIAGAFNVAIAVPASVLRPPRLIGRSAELGTALRAWQSDRVFCLEGESGMGKSRLLQEITAHRPDTVAVQARPGDAVVPFATLVRLLRAILTRTRQLPDAEVRRALATLLPELVDAASPPADGKAGRRLALGEALAEMMNASNAAGVGAVIVDDLHFADDASLETLLQLSRGPAGASLHWGFARRPAEGSAALAELTDALIEEQRFEPVALTPLTIEQLTELLGSLGLPQIREAELAIDLHRHSGGNPMFALETLREAWAGTGLAGGRLPRPVSVTRLIERRVMRLSRAAIRLARCAAVAGVDFSIDLAAVVLEVPVIDLADAWNELEQAHVFDGGAFAHDLIHEAVRAGLPSQIARHLHGDVASHLQQRNAAPASIATHWLAADEPARSLPFLHRAGDLAAGQRRFGEAASAYEREAGLRLDQGDAAGAFEAALCMRRVCFELDLASRTDTALELLERAASTPPQRASAYAERAIVCMHRGAMADAERAVMAGLAALGTLAEPGLRASLHQHLAAVRVWQNRPAEAFELMQAIESEVEASGDAERRIEFAQGMAVVLEHLDRPGDSARWNRRAADTALAAGELPRAAQVLLNLAIGWRDSGQLDRAFATLEEASALLASLPEEAIPYSSLDLNFGIVLRDLGRYREALDWFERAIARGRVHVPGWVPLFLCHRARLWLALGQFARAQQDLDAAAVDGAPPLALASRALLHAQLLHLLGQDGAPAFERAASNIGRGARALSRHRLVLARCIALDPADALAAAGEVLDSAIASQRLGLMAAARTRLCQAAFALGHVAEAARHARQIVALADGVGSDDVYRGEVWLAAHRALAPIDPQAAATALHVAETWLHETARSHVPEPFRESFLHRNPVNRELLALAQRFLE